MLREAGVPTELRVGRGLIHGFLRARFVSAAAQAECDALAAAITAALRRSAAASGRQLLRLGRRAARHRLAAQRFQQVGDQL